MSMSPVNVVKLVSLVVVLRLVMRIGVVGFSFLSWSSDVHVEYTSVGPLPRAPRPVHELGVFFPERPPSHHYAKVGMIG